MKISKMVTELWNLQECSEKINQRGITQKLRKGEQSFLTRRLDPVKLHDDIPNSY